MGIKCEILLKKTNKYVYGSGDIVEGTIHYTVDKPTTCDYIVIFLQGKLKGKNPLIETDEDLICKEVFVSLHETILRKENHVIDTGDYSQDFEFMLPKDLPSSFKNKTCAISYKILADIKLSGFFGGIKEFQKEIQVQGNVKPLLDQRSLFGLTKTPFPSGKPIDLEVEITKKFIEAGENICLNYAIYNEADIPVTGVKAKLISEITYNYDSKKKKVQRSTVNESLVYSPGADSDSEATYSCIVPTTENLHSIQNSKFFKKDYKIVVTATFPFPHTNCSVEIPIVISANNLIISNLS